MKYRKRSTLQRWGLGLVGILIFLFVSWQLGRVAILILLSFLVAYVLNPLVTRLTRIPRVGRLAATVITMLGLIVGFAGVLFVLLPRITQEFRMFLDRLPAKADQLQALSDRWLQQRLGISLPTDWRALFGDIYTYLREDSDNLVAPAAVLAKQFFGTTFSALFAMAGAVMFPLFLFFLLKDFPLIIGALDQLVPPRHRRTSRYLAREVDRSLSSYLHGQFTVMLVLGTLYSIGYAVVGIPLALGVGLLTGLLCFVPYLGAAMGFLLALTMAIVSFSGIGMIVAVIAVFVTVQLLDAAVITPRILGGSLGLEPLWIIVVLMAGGEVFGFLGVLLAVPTTAVLKVLVGFGLEHYQKSVYYLMEASEPSTENASEDSPASLP